MKVGVMDIGSNSVRLLISENGISLNKFLQTTRLANGLDSTGFLGRESVEKTLSALSFFISKANECKVDKLYCFATSAVRTAKNGKDFIFEVKQKLSLDVDLLSEAEEGEVGYLGALGNKNGGIIDIGGGSTEIQVVDNGDKIYCKSLKMGAVRLTDACGQKRDKLEQFIDQRISEYGVVPKTTFYGIGGTVTTVAAMLLGLQAYESEKIEGYVISYKDLVRLSDKLCAMSVDERKKLKGLQPERADIISSGVMLLRKLFVYLGIDGLVVSDKDNLEGYLYRVNYEQKN